MNNSNCDVAIIGGGAAGLSAALLLGRSLRNVVVFDEGQPRNAPAQHMHGFLSRDGFAPAELLRLGRNEVQRYGVEIVAASVENVTGTLEAGFTVTTAVGDSITARRVLFASGIVDELPQLEGFRDAWGTHLLHCPYCHGYEVRGEALAVYGPTPGATFQALLVRQLSDDLTFLTDGTPLAVSDEEKLRARGIRIHTGKVAALEQDGAALRGVRMSDGTLLSVAAVFAKPEPRPNSALLAGLGCTLDAEGFPLHDGRGQTDAAGIWVAGNLVDPRAQVIAAAGQANSTAMDLNFDLVDEDVRLAMRA